MRHTGIVNLSRSKFANTVLKNNVVIILAICFVVGIIVGVLAIGNSEALLNIAKSDFDSYLTLRRNSSFGNIFFSSFLSVLPYALLIFLCGTSIVGIALTPLSVMYRGFCYGLTAAYLYNTMSLQGIAFNSLILIPTTLIAVFGYLTCGREAVNFSINLAKISMPNGQAVSIYNDFRLYCKRSLIYFIFYIASALLDAIMCGSFIKFFNF